MHSVRRLQEASSVIVIRVVHLQRERYPFQPACTAGGGDILRVAWNYSTISRLWPIQTVDVADWRNPLTTSFDPIYETYIPIRYHPRTDASNAILSVIVRIGQ